MALSTGSAVSYPVSYETTGTINGTRYKNCIGKGADTAAVTGNDYSNGGSSSTATITYSFEFPDIPENAEITNVACQVKGHLENTSRSTAKLQMLAGSTEKGSESKFTSTSAQTITMTPGTWNRQEVDEMKLRFTIGYYGGLINGVTVTVTYQWNDVSWTVSVSGENATPAGDSEVSDGKSFTVRITQEDKPKVTDNGVDVSDSLVQGQESPESYTVEDVSGASYGFAANSSGYYQSQNKGVSKSAALCKVSFYVPVAATITFSFINYAEQGYDFGVFGNIDETLSTSYYSAGSSGATITDSSYKLACNTSTYNSSSVKTLTYQMSAGEHFIYVKYSKDDASDKNNDTLQFKVAITLNEQVTYDTYWEYTIASVTEAHTIVVSAPVAFTLYRKINGSWAVITGAIWKKSTSWVKQDDPGSAITAGDYELIDI